MQHHRCAIIQRVSERRGRKGPFKSVLFERQLAQKWRTQPPWHRPMNRYHVHNLEASALRNAHRRRECSRLPAPQPACPPVPCGSPLQARLGRSPRQWHRIPATSSLAGLSGTKVRIMSLLTSKEMSPSFAQISNTHTSYRFHPEFARYGFSLRAWLAPSPRLALSTSSVSGTERFTEPEASATPRANSSPSDAITPRTTISAPGGWLCRNQAPESSPEYPARPAAAGDFHCKESPEPPMSCTSAPLLNTFNWPCCTASITVLCCAFNNSCIASVEKPGWDISRA